MSQQVDRAQRLRMLHYRLFDARINIGRPRRRGEVYACSVCCKHGTFSSTHKHPPAARAAAIAKALDALQDLKKSA